MIIKILCRKCGFNTSSKKILTTRVPKHCPICKSSRISSATTDKLPPSPEFRSYKKK